MNEAVKFQVKERKKERRGNDKQNETNNDVHQSIRAKGHTRSFSKPFLDTDYQEDRQTSQMMRQNILFMEVLHSNHTFRADSRDSHLPKYWDSPPAYMYPGNRSTIRCS
jgi:hypothetical protein